MIVSSIRYLQSRFNALAEVTASAVATTNVNEGFNQFVNIIDEGDSAGITIEFPEHVGVESNRADTKDQLQANKEWLKSEFVAFISNDNPIFTFNVAQYKTDIGYLVDALTYDMLYGGNSSTVQEAIYYFNNNNSFTSLLDSEKQTVVDAFARLRFAAQRIIRGLVVTPTTGGSNPNTESQDFSSGNATAVESSAIDALIQIVEDVVDAASLSGLPTKIYPVIDTEPVLQVSAANAILGQRNLYIEDAISFNNLNNPTLTYDVEKCKRDVGYIIDAIYRDAQLSTNHNSITAALAYKRANT